MNTASGEAAVVQGGSYNDAIGEDSTVYRGNNKEASTHASYAP